MTVLESSWVVVCLQWPVIGVEEEVSPLFGFWIDYGDLFCRNPVQLGALECSYDRSSMG